MALPAIDVTPTLLADYLSGKLTATEMDAVEEYLRLHPDALNGLTSHEGDWLEDRVRHAVKECPLLTSADRRTLGPPSASVEPVLSGETSTPHELRDHPRYRVQRQIGQGGMGAVYLAEHRIMRRLVALKMIQNRFVANPATIERFHREINAAARLNHPNIVTAFDAEQVGSTHFLAMEYVEGESLKEYLHRKQSLAICEACDIVRQAALGLQHAHEKGMVHRDIKPHNLMRTPAGQVKILDFGLASLRAGDEAPLSATVDDEMTTVEHAAEGRPSFITASGSIMGTPDYMAPEQTHDTHTVDIRADIYALGCTLYQLLTGRPPFSGVTMEDKLLAHRQQTAASVRSMRPEIPEGLAQIIGRMMAKAPAERYQSPGQVALALQPFAALPSAHGHWPRGRARVAVALLFLAVGVAAAAGIYTITIDRSDDVTITTDDPTLQLLVQNGGDDVYLIDSVRGESWKLDPEMYPLSDADRTAGLFIDFPGKETILLRRTGETTASVLRATAIIPPGQVRRFAGHTGTVRAVAFSPDGRYAASASGLPFSDRTVRLWNVISGQQVWAAKFPVAINSVAFCSKDFVVLGGADGLVQVADVKTGRPVRTFDGSTLGTVFAVAASHNDHLVLAGGEQGVCVWEMKSGELLKGKVLRGFNSSVVSAAFSAGGLEVFMKCSDGTVRIWDLRVHQELRSFKGNPIQFGHGIAFSRTGQHALFGHGNHLILWNIETGKVDRKFERLDGGGEIVSVAISHDGRHALSGGSDAMLRVWEMSTGKLLHTFRGHTDTIWSVSFSPNDWFALSGSGDRLVDDHREGHRAKQVVLPGADRCLRLWRLPSHIEKDSLPGDAIVDLNPGAPQLKLIQKHEWLERNLTMSAFSPDGKYYGAAGDNQGEGKGVRVWELAAGKEVITVPGAAWLSFSADSRRVITSRPGDPIIQAWDLHWRRIVQEFIGHPFLPIRAVETSDGRTLISSNLQTPICFWNTETRKQKGLFTPGGRLHTFSVSGNGKSMIVCGYPGADPLIRLIDVETQREMRTWEHPYTDSIRVLMASSGEEFCTWSGTAKHARSLLFWRIDQDKPVRSLSLPEDSSGFNLSAFSSDLKWLLFTHNGERIMRLLNLDTGKVVAQVSLSHAAAGHHAFSLDNRHALFTTMRPSSIYVCEMPAEVNPPAVNYAAPLAYPTDKHPLVLDLTEDIVRLKAVTDFREAHGLDLAALRQWLAKLPSGFRPLDISFRAGSQSPLFDGIAIHDQRDVPFDAHLDLDRTGGDHGKDWDTMTAAGWTLRIVCPYADGQAAARHHIWFKDPRPWVSHGMPVGQIAGKLDQWRKDGLRPWRFFRDGLESVLGDASRPFGMILEPDEKLPWELHTELPPAELKSKLIEARMQGNRPDALGGFGSGNNRSFALLVVPNPARIAWDYRTDMTVAEYEAALAEQKELGRRPMAVSSEQNGALIRYTAIWIGYSPKK